MLYDQNRGTHDSLCHIFYFIILIITSRYKKQQTTLRPAVLIYFLVILKIERSARGRHLVPIVERIT